jgi:hypothetical protein
MNSERQEYYVGIKLGNGSSVLKPVTKDIYDMRMDIVNRSRETIETRFRIKSPSHCPERTG